MTKDQGINIDKFEKYLLKNYGKKCKKYAIGCMTCQVWRMYEDLDKFIKLDFSFKEKDEYKSLYKWR